MNSGQDILQAKDLESFWRNALIYEGFSKQTLNVATDMQWCLILHKHTGLNTVTFLQGKNYTLNKDVFVTCRLHGTPDRSPSCNLFKEKRAKNKGACESTPLGHVRRMQWPPVEALQAV